MARNQILAEVIRAIKSRFNLSQADIAWRTGVKAPYLSDLINGRYPLSRLYSGKLNAVFGTSKEYLETGVGDIFDKLDMQENSVTMPREVFDQITRLTETVLSQQRTIENLTGLQKGGVAGARNVAPGEALG